MTSLWFSILGRRPAVLSPLHPRQKKAGLNFCNKDIHRTIWSAGRLQNLLHSGARLWDTALCLEQLKHSLSWVHGGNVLGDLSLSSPSNSETGTKPNRLQPASLPVANFHPWIWKSGDLTRVTKHPWGHLLSLSTTGNASLRFLYHTSQQSSATEKGWQQNPVLGRFTVFPK